MTNLDTLLDIESIKLGDAEFARSVREDFTVDSGNIGPTLAAQAQKVAMYIFAHETALDHERRLKTELERAYAQLDVQARRDLVNAGIKPTEKMVENTVITSELYIQIQNELLDVQKQVGLTKALMTATNHLRDSLQALSYNYRAEVKADSYMATRMSVT